MKLTYFDFEGRAEAPRLTLHYAGIPFEDQRLSMPEFKKLQSQGLFTYNQIPVLQVGDKQYPQSLAILRYVGKISKLYPEDPLEQMECDSHIESCEEIWSKVGYTWVEDKEEMKRLRLQYEEKTVKPWLKHLDTQIQNSKTGYFGKEISIADIYLFTTLRFISTDFLEFIDHDLSKYPALQQFYNKFISLPKIAEWYRNHQFKLVSDILK